MDPAPACASDLGGKLYAPAISARPPTRRGPTPAFPPGLGGKVYAPPVSQTSPSQAGPTPACPPGLGGQKYTPPISPKPPSQTHIRVCPHTVLTWKYFHRIACTPLPKPGTLGATSNSSLDIFFKTQNQHFHDIDHPPSRCFSPDNSSRPSSATIFINNYGSAAGFDINAGWDFEFDFRSGDRKDLRSFLKKSHVMLCPHINIWHDIILGAIYEVHKHKAGTTNRLICHACQTAISINWTITPSRPGPSHCCITVKRPLGLGLSEECPKWLSQCVRAEYDPGAWSDLCGSDAFWCRHQSLRGIIDPPGVEKLWPVVNEMHKEAQLDYPGQDKEHRRM